MLRLPKWLRSTKKTIQQDPPRTPAFSFAGVTEHELDQMLKYGKASSSLAGYESKKFIELPYGVIRKDLPTLQKKELFMESILLILGCQFDDVDLSSASQNEMMSFLLWIKEQQTFIYKIEEMHLASDPDPEMMAAGLHLLDEFGALSTIHQLAGSDPLKHPAIEALPYFKVYEILKLENVQRQIQKNHAEIIKNK